MTLPHTERAPVIRADDTDQKAWDNICALIREPQGPDAFYAYVDFLDDPAFHNLTARELLERVPAGYPRTFLFVVDSVAVGSPEFPILVIDLYTDRGRSFRAIPSQIQSIENNLSIANMDFAEFADNVDSDGVFRGFAA